MSETQPPMVLVFRGSSTDRRAITEIGMTLGTYGIPSVLVDGLEDGCNIPDDLPLGGIMIVGDGLEVDLWDIRSAHMLTPIAVVNSSSTEWPIVSDFIFSHDPTDATMQLLDEMTGCTNHRQRDTILGKLNDVETELSSADLILLDKRDEQTCAA